MNINNHPASAIIGKAVLYCAINTALLKLSLSVQSAIPGLPDNFFASLIGPALVLLTTYVFIKIDKRSFREIGLTFESTTLKKFLAGLIAGAVVMSAYILCFMYASGLRIQPNKNANMIFILVNALPVIILLAFMEEIIFRGYPLVILKNKTGQLASIIITSLLFGLYHVVFGWGLAGFISTGTWGLAFGLLAVYSNGISMPTGFHAAGNLMQLVLGTTGNRFSIWSPVYKNGQQVINFVPAIEATVIAQLILLAFIILCIRSLLRKPAWQ